MNIQGRKSGHISANTPRGAWAAAAVLLVGASLSGPAVAQQGWIPEECGPDFEEANIIIGTEGNDMLSGTRGKDVIFGLGGDDKIDGGGDDDCLIGGPGNDYLLGGPGNDVLVANGEGQQNGDAIHERNRLNGSHGTDTCYGSYGFFYTSEDRPTYVTTFDNCEIIYEPRQDGR